MYAETGLLFPCFQNFAQEVQQFEDLYKAHKFNASMSNHLQASMILEYDMGGEGDLFKAPELIIEEPVMSLDPITAAISMISCGEDVITRQALKAADIESLQEQQLLSEVLYECEKDLLEQAAMELPLSEVLEIKIPALKIDENQIQENNAMSDSSFQKSVSSECLSSMDWMLGPVTTPTPNFLDFPGMDFSAAYGMRRAFSEGDIKTLGNGSISLIRSPHELPMIISKSISEERKEKLSRYRNKKTKRNFGRKIKYACRKALADSQPRIRGRFAKTEEYDGKRE